MTDTGFCYSCDSQVPTNKSPVVSCARCGGNFLVVFEMNPAHNIQYIRPIVCNIDVAAVRQPAAVGLPATSHVAIAASSAVLASLPNNTQASTSTGTSAAAANIKTPSTKRNALTETAPKPEMARMDKENEFAAVSLPAAIKLPWYLRLPGTVRPPTTVILPATSQAAAFSVVKNNTSSSAGASASASAGASASASAGASASTSAGASAPTSAGTSAAANIKILSMKRNALTPLLNEKHESNENNKLASQSKESETEPKPKMSRMDKENDVDDTCSICFDEWTNSGPHRVVSLKCGHLFGESCIRKWLASHPKCVQCNCVNRLTDIRRIFARSVTSRNTDDYDSEHTQHMELQKKYDILLKQIESNKNSAQAGSSVFIGPQLEPPQPIAGTLTQIIPSTPQSSQIAATPTQRIRSYNEAVRMLFTIRTSFGDRALRCPDGLCLRNNGQEIVVTNTNRHYLLVFSINGEYIRSIGKGYIRFPSNVAVTHTNKYVVADRVVADATARIIIFKENGEFERHIFTCDEIISVKTNPSAEILALVITYSGRSYNLLRMSQEGTMLKNLDLSMIDLPSDFAQHENKYYICGTNRIIRLDEEGVISLSFQSYFNFPCRIFIGANNKLIVNGRHNEGSFAYRLKMHVFSNSGILEKIVTYPFSRIRVCSGIEMLPDGSMVTIVKKENSVYIFNPLNI